ncbi:phosphoribosylaminoimidazolesuccinocarboxamide synthase [Chryseomicrobium sp. FSL W7-1435]|uniref:phosphoribosylaminoimidazolesuccinocarboxamide synthase n=1 Tax=Chryseomicrobium sp. FSL W7-1435 TaxID=2921704 RepID=UPI00315A3225
MQKGALVYEGKAKQLFLTEDPEVLYVHYKNSATAFNGEKKEEIDGKARLNNQITAVLFEQLHTKGIPSHFIEQLSETEQLVKKVDIIPLEVVVRNIAAGSLAKRLGFDEGHVLKQPLVEFYYKDDALGDPLLTDAHIALLELVSEDEKLKLEHLARKINQALQEIFQTIGVTLVDFKVEFGRTASGDILLADEISPDTCRLWDTETKQKLDKDVFRQNLGNLTDGYAIILSRLGGNSQ